MHSAVCTAEFLSKQLAFFFRVASREVADATGALNLALTMRPCLTVGLIAVTAFVSIPMRSTLEPGLVGLCLTYVLQLQGLFQWAVRQRYRR